MSTQAKNLPQVVLWCWVHNPIFSSLAADFSSWVWFFTQPGGDQTEIKKSYEAFAHLMEFFLPFMYLELIWNLL